MAVDLSLPFFNPVTGETFRLLEVSQQAYLTEWHVQPGGYVPFEHVHLNQDEVFHVEAGRLQVRIDGRERQAGPGETLTVRRGRRHLARNSGEETLRCRLEYRPALDTFQVFQCFSGLTRDGELNRRGLVHPLKMMYFMQKMRARALGRPSGIPTPLFRALMLAALPLGEVLGWQAQYRRYTQP
jgi:quercetin dioxygenase-like cupin family protein